MILDFSNQTLINIISKSASWYIFRVCPHQSAMKESSW